MCLNRKTDPPIFNSEQSPNPEEHAAFEYAIKLGEKQNADILIATDPDADRLGIAVRDHDGEFTVLTGNQTGALLLHYLLSEKQKLGQLPPRPVVMKTIVTSELGRAVASAFGAHTIDTLTGFKFIGEKNQAFEERRIHVSIRVTKKSYGYLIVTLPEIRCGASGAV
ncbi:hypothetical protein R0I01_17290 [Bacillus pumilus]|nr:hypothetical protein R0I01_17290 [Bacillus pumilus]